MKKIINYRPIFYCFLAFSIGIGFAHFLFLPNILIISITILSFLTVVIICIKYKLLFRLLCVLFAFIIGIGAFFIDSNNFKGAQFDGKEMLVTGRISSKVSKYDGFAYLILENVIIGENHSLNINVCVSGYNELEQIKTGNYISFVSEIYNEFLFENDKFNHFSYKNNAPYFCYTSYEDITFKNGDLMLSEKVKNYLKNFYSEHMSINGSQFAYNMLFGEKSELNREIKESFGISGVAHLLTVSGLHINFLVLLIFLFLNKLKLGKFKEFFILAFILFLYAYMCNFSASVVRAGLMCLVFLSSGLFGRPYDLLNSIAISGFIILAFAPLMIFDVGFQMSFACVLAIAFLFKPLTTFFKKMKLPNVLNSALAIDISTTIAIIPLLGIYFGELSILTTLTNLVCIPLFAFSYMLLLIITIFGAVFNFAGIFLLLPDFALKIIISVTCFVAEIELLILTLPHMNIIWLIFFYTSLFILSSFMLVKFLDRIIIINIIAIICVTFSLVFNLPTTPNSYTYTQLNSNSPCSIITTQSGEVLVIGNLKNVDYLIDYLNYKRICQIDYLIVTSENLIENKDTQKFIFDYKVNRIINCEEDAGEVGNFNVEFIYLNQLKKAVLISVNNFDVLFACDVYLGVNQIEILKQNFENRKIDLIFSKKETQGFFNLTTFDLKVTTFKQSTSLEKSCSLYSFGTFTFDFENGKIENMRKV